MPKIQKLEDPTRDIAYDAMCVWEWAIDARARKWQPLTQLFELNGSGEMRDELLDSVPFVRESWDRARAVGYEESFDWEFVPWFMENCVTFSDSEWVYNLKQLPPGFEAPTPPEGKEGFAIFCDTLCQGRTPCNTVTEEGAPTQWEIYDTEREAQLSLIDVLEEHIRQFKEGARTYDEIDSDLYVQAVTVHPDGSLSTEDGEYEPPEQH